VAVEVSDDAEGEVSVADMAWVLAENTSAQTVVFGKLINEAFPVIR
jgi:hypothetical protein